jgi:hypothetical protein
MVYAPGTEETDLKKLNMSLQQNAATNTTNATNIATNTAAIAAIQAGPLTSGNVAIQSDQETATSTSLAVTPGRQQFHPSAAKAWVIFTGSGVNGAQTVNASYNVSGVSRISAGIYAVSFTTSFSSANYACVATPEGINGWGLISTRAAGGVNVAFEISTNTLTDPTFGHVICFGDQ